jgi:DNA (cytosine-5)-methyltransferase 1
MSLTIDEDLTYTDIFCGAGGSSIGLTEAGLKLKLAANHWDRAIETHSANFRDAEHLCADVSNYDMRRLPHTRILWASPICTENSPAGGRKRRPKGQLDMFEEAGHVPGEGMERTRATFHDVIRATEVHRYDAVIVENVTEAADWELWDWWLGGMVLLGYNYQLVSVSSAHIGGEGNAYAPQWRDRLYVVFTRKGIPLPDVSPKPLAWCPVCEKAVVAFQSWKRPERPKIGKYGRQYVYVCPDTTCAHAVAEPFVLPAASAIDWTDLGTRIGDRKKPLAVNTMRRIRAGLEMFGPAALVGLSHGDARPGTGYMRARPADGSPFGTISTSRDEALATSPFLTLPRSGRVRTIGVEDEPLSSIMTSGSNHGLVIPLGGYNRTSELTTTAEPFRTRVVRDTDALITPPFLTTLRGNMEASGVDEPVPSVMVRGHEALTVPPFVVKHYGGWMPPERTVTPVSNPFGVITATGGNHALVVPYRGRRSRATTTGEPLHTLATRDSAALVQPDDTEVLECRLRMLKPREHLRAQRFHDAYIVKGNQGEQTMQAGNAVSANVAHWLGRAVAAVL